MNDRLTRSSSRESIISAVSRVGDWEIGDRCQIGNRVGNVVFIGPTRFAPGEWIGVVLDEPLGKNDGSVDGQRYFKCEPNHGLFCKASKLERVITSPEPRGGSVPSETKPTSPYAKEFGFDIGDRVVVSGGKVGTLRFLGKTEFQDGIWAGIELDQPIGKNDGSVQGKRYFTCKHPYGLFAFASKISRAVVQAPGKIKVRHTKTSALRQRSGSHESLSSIGASSVASSRISRLALGTPRNIQRPLVITQGQTDVVKTLQDSLREKEKHLEQMIRERDIERNEMARLTSRCEEAESRLAQIDNGNSASSNSELAALKQKISVYETEMLEITEQLKESKEQYENLTFRYDEEVILNAELKEKIQGLEKAAKTLELELNDEKKNSQAHDVEQLQKELSEWKSKNNDLEEEARTFAKMRDETESKLQRALSDNERLSTMIEKTEEKMRSLMETVTERESAMGNMELKARELSEQITRTESEKKTLEEAIASTEAAQKALLDEVNELKKQVGEKEAEISSIIEEKTEQQANIKQLNDQIARMEECLLSSNSSDELLRKELHLLREQSAQQDALHSSQIAELRRTIEELANSLSEANNKVNALESECSALKASVESATKEKDVLKESIHALEIENNSSLKTSNDLSKKVAEGESNIISLKKANSELELELSKAMALVEQHSSEVSRLNNSLSNVGSENAELRKALEILRQEAEVASSLNLQIVEANAAKEDAKRELGSSRDRVVSLESECSSLKATLKSMEAELSALKEKVEHLESERESIVDENSQLRKQVNANSIDNDSLREAKNQRELNLANALTRVKQLTEQVARMEEMESKSSSSDELLKREIKMLREQNAQAAENSTARLSELNAAKEKLLKELEEARNQIVVRDANCSKLQDSLKSVEKERIGLMDTINLLKGENGANLKEIVDLKKQAVQKEMEIASLNELKVRNEEKLSGAAAELTELANRVCSLEEALRKSSSNEELLKGQIQTLQQQVAQATDASALEVSSLNASKKALSEELEAAKRHLASTESDFGALKASFESCEAEKSVLIGKISVLEDEKQNSLKRICELESQVASCAEVSAKNTADLSAAKAKFENAEQEIKKLMSTLATVKEENEGLKKSVKAKQSSIAELETELDKMKFLHKKCYERNVLVEKAKDHEVELAKKEKEVTQLTEQIKNLEISLTKTNEERDTVIKELTELKELHEQHLAENNLKIEELTSSRDNVSKELILAVGQLDSLKTEQENLGSSLRNANEELRKMTEALIASQSNEASLVAELKKLKEENVEGSRKTSSLEHEFEVEKAQKLLLIEKLENEKMCAVRDLEREAAKKQKELDELRKENSELKDEISGHNDEVQLLHELIETRNAECESLRSQVEKSKAATSELMKTADRKLPVDADYAKLSSENRDLKQEKECLENELNSLKDRIFALEREKLENEIEVSEARQRNALFLDLNEDWNRKEAEYQSLINKLRAEASKTETEKVEEISRENAFLDSIIASQQKKIQELKDTVDILMNKPAVETMAEMPLERGEKPPRAYCDICEQFDLHDTTDCPTQEMDLRDYESHSHYALDKNSAPRPYCDICEAFLHETTDCPSVRVDKPKKSKDYTF